MSFSKVSGTKDEHGEWAIEPAELDRACPPQQGQQTDQSALRYADTELHLRVALAELRLADLKNALDDMRSQRDMWRAQAERLTIAGQGAATPPVRSGFMARIGLGRARYG